MNHFKTSTSATFSTPLTWAGCYLCIAFTFLLSVHASTSVAADNRYQNQYSTYQTSSQSDEERRHALLKYFKGWKGVSYQYGGTSKRGVDCSGFVHLALKGALAIDAPRSTELLSKIRHRINKNKLQAGDIILFKISSKTMHTGIYIGQGQFIHASKSKGVMASNLDNPYWKGVYSKSVRISTN